MMVDVGAYGALGSMDALKNAVSSGAQTISQDNAFASAAGAPARAASQQAMVAFQTSARLANRTQALSKAAMAKGLTQWTNVANEIEDMGGTEATRGAGYGEPMYEDVYMEEGMSSNMRMMMYVGMAVAGASVLYLFARN